MARRKSKPAAEPEEEIEGETPNTEPGSTLPEEDVSAAELEPDAGKPGEMPDADKALASRAEVEKTPARVLVEYDPGAISNAIFNGRMVFPGHREIVPGSVFDKAAAEHPGRFTIIKEVDDGR